MLGFRGCRLSVVYPEITEMQARAVTAAAAANKKVEVHGLNLSASLHASQAVKIPYGRAKPRATYLVTVLKFNNISGVVMLRLVYDRILINPIGYE